MNGYDVYKTYHAIKLHFTTKDYNFFLYDGKTRVSVDSFEKRRDKYNFHKLARKYTESDIVPFLVSNFINDEKQWSKDLLQPEAHTNYIEWTRITESMTKVFSDEISKIATNPKEFNSLFICPNGEHPKLLTLFLQKQISIETMTILQSILDYLAIWDKKITDTIIYPKIAFKIRKYNSFLTVDCKKYKAQLKTLLSDN
jgi:hypothetical protein